LGGKIFKGKEIKEENVKEKEEGRKKKEERVKKKEERGKKWKGFFGGKI
jgi:hypothetical protein